MLLFLCDGYFSRIFAFAHERLQAPGLDLSLFYRQAAWVTDGNPHGFPMHLRLKNVRLDTVRRDAESKARRSAVPEKCLWLAVRAVVRVDSRDREVDFGHRVKGS